MAKTLRIGTRGSKLALRQAGMVADALRAAVPDVVIEMVEILTSGDWKPEQGETRLAESEGGKGLFAREIENAILSGHVDCGVHSLKDLPAILPDGLVIDHVLPREDPRDALLSNHPGGLEGLPHGATVGTVSLRRQAFLLSWRPDLNVVPLRGNVPTRIKKLRDGQVDAMILAVAGLKRLGLESEIAETIEPQVILPSVAQGIIGIELRADDDMRRAWFDKIHCRDTGLCATAERAALAALGGSCRTPVGAYAVRERDKVRLDVIVASPDGLQIFHEGASASVTATDQAAALGTDIGAELKRRVPEGILS